ncbi:MAG: hypothetical protein Q8T03_11905 [Bacteroidota bacterium]|nr:hypothetical protein [Bacteroidota bacterium]
MKRFIIITIFTILLFDINAQTKEFSIGLGFSSTLPFQQTIGHGLGYSITPFLNAKYSRHEILLGPDLYFIGSSFNKESYPLIIGGQGEYRYHFLKKNKKHNFFLNTTIQYVQYQNTCLFAKPYNYVDLSVCFDYGGELLKQKSLINTYGLGVQCNFLKRFYAYSIIGLGFNYSQLNELDGRQFGDGNRINFIGTFRLGLSFSLFKSSKADT